jgi:hypothetical protein
MFGLRIGTNFYSAAHKIFELLQRRALILEAKVRNDPDQRSLGGGSSLVI